jgi:hypothetical protein
LAAIIARDDGHQHHVAGGAKSGRLANFVSRLTSPGDSPATADPKGFGMFEETYALSYQSVGF